MTIVNIKTITDAYATRVNDQDYNIAEDINNLQVAVKALANNTQSQSGFANTETLSGDKVLTDDSEVIQLLDPNGADREVELPELAPTNHSFVIGNTNGSTYLLAVVDADGNLIHTITAGSSFLFVSDENQWVVIGVDTTDVSTNYSENMAVNTGFDLAQRQAPGTYTTIADKAYGPDQWWVTRENADIQYIRSDGAAESGITSKYFGTFKKITNAGKFFICQPFPTHRTISMRGKNVVFQLKMKASSSKTIRMAVLELQAAGTADAPPATLVTAFGVDGTDPTFGANVAIITSAEDQAVTTAWQTFNIVKTIPSDSKNMFIAIWSDADFSIDDTLSLAEVDFFAGSTFRTWHSRELECEIVMCRRYFWKTFELDTAPAQNTATLLGVARAIAGKAGATALAAIIVVRLPVPMFKTPVVTTYNPNAANAEVRDSSAGVNCSATANSASHGSPDTITISATGNASTAVGNIMDVHIAAEAKIL